MEQRERVDLDRPNPHAALAIEQLDKAQELLTQLNAQARAIANSIQQLPQPQTPSATLNSETAKQQQIQESIGDISSDLSRSARHEDRLGNKLGAEKLSVQAESIGKLTSGSVGNAKKELDRNSKLTEQAEHQQADARTSESWL